MRILVTAGPTREFIDPIRFITNPSTGSMGYAIAKIAKKRSHRVTLISGPVACQHVRNIKTISVITTDEMFAAVKREFKDADCLIMSAAVCDFKPKRASKHKIKKNNPALKKMPLIQTPDILLWAGKNKATRLIVGFCMETKGLINRARQKLKTKNLDIIVANKIAKNNPAFGNRPTKVFILDKWGTIENIGPASKEKIAEILLNKIESMRYNTIGMAA